MSNKYIQILCLCYAFHVLNSHLFPEHTDAYETSLLSSQNSEIFSLNRVLGFDSTWQYSLFHKSLLLLFMLAQLETNMQEENPGEMQSCCLFHRNLPFMMGSFLLSPLSGAVHCLAIAVQSRVLWVRCFGGDGAFLFCQQTVVTGSAELCCEATALERSSVVFHACRNHFDCRADLNLGQRLVWSFLSTDSVLRLWDRE